MRQLNFQNIMYGYAAESIHGYAATLKVCIPDLFPDKKFGAAIDYNTNNGSAKNILINANPPAISNFINNRNYIIVGLGARVNIDIGDRVVIAFMNSDPRTASFLRMGW